MSDGDYQVLYPDNKHLSEYLIGKIKKLSMIIKNNTEFGYAVRKLINDKENLQTLKYETS